VSGAVRWLTGPRGSGSTGAPKGVVHTTGGYLLYAAVTHRYVFDYREGEVYACVADIGCAACLCPMLAMELLSAGGMQLDHGPLVCRVRPPVQRRHYRDVRVRADLP
jgi:hypothetical protein